MILATMKAMRAAKARGMVTLSDLCAEFEISGSVARTRLRQAGVKPRDGIYAWERDGQEIQRVRTVLLGDRAADALIG
jgi:hypothetical protein